MTLRYLVPGLALVAACDISQSGGNERLDFTPTECGYKLIGCNFADSIAVGGTIEVQITPRDGGTTTGLDLATDTPDLLAVEPVPGSSPRAWQLTALGAGVGRLAALDDGGAEIDFLEVPMQAAVGLGLDEAGGRADGPTQEPGFDEVWTVDADRDAQFNVTARVGPGARAMGRFRYVPEPVGFILNYELDHHLEDGFIHFMLPEGDWSMTYRLEIAPTVEVGLLFHAVAAQTRSP